MNEIVDKKPLDSHENFINRELSWLKFNSRVLKEASLRDLPPMERLRFIAIFSSNLDEFFMVRVANLITKTEKQTTRIDAAGLTAKQQLEAVSELSHKLMRLSYRYFFSVVKELKNWNIRIERYQNLSNNGKKWVKNYFDQIVYPVLTPLAVDAGHPFPFLSNKSINIAISFETKNKKDLKVSFVEVPSVLPRLVKVETENEEEVYIFLEEVILEYISKLYTGQTIKDFTIFRITRNSEMIINDLTTDDLLQEVKKSLKKRSRGDVVRLEIIKPTSKTLLNFLMKNLAIDKSDIYEINGPIDLTCLFGFIDKNEFSHLCYEPQSPQRPLDLIGCEDIYALAREKDILFHHPFESFEPIIKFVQDAANDPNVLAIKQTLYRVSGNSPIVSALSRAAENGKQVTVLVELKARFDEENNIGWARQLEKAGCHVIYGLVGLKTHSKITLVVRKEGSGIKRYVHLGTGNYNDNTAKLYTDMGLITTNEQIGSDASAFFNVISGYSEPPLLDRLTMAPVGLRKKIYELIDNEISNVKNGGIGHMIIKVNSLFDKEMTIKLYEASRAGVKIELIIRGICCLIAGKKGVSENISVRSIIGRYLEHTRIFYFYNGGEEEVYLSSADLMRRNLNDRVELFFPVEDIGHIERIKEILSIYLQDNKKAHNMMVNGNYRRLNGEPAIIAQEKLYKMSYDVVKSSKPSLEQRMKPHYKKEVFIKKENIQNA